MFAASVSQKLQTVTHSKLIMVQDNACFYILYPLLRNPALKIQQSVGWTPSEAPLTTGNNV